MISAGASHLGLVREKNEDRIFFSNNIYAGLPNLYAVADGMGGHKAGAVASELAMDYFKSYLVSENLENGSELILEEDVFDLMVSALQHANKNVFKASSNNQNFEGMGTTFTAATVFGDKLYAIHVGDCRIYKFDGKELIQITHDHTFAMELYRYKKITYEEAISHPKKNALTRAVGTNEIEEVDTIIMDFEKDSTFLLCSDGLTNMISDEKIENILKEDISLEEMKEQLILTAIDNGGFDNISVILIGRM